MTYVPSPVVQATVRFLGTGRFLTMAVWFADDGEIDRLIDALTRLRKSENFDHIHLQDRALVDNRNAGLGEITFFRPGCGASGAEHELMDDAAELIVGAGDDEAEER